MAFVNQRHVTEGNLDEAITGVIDAYASIGLSRRWGTGGSASADGMKWDVHPQSFMSEYHVRYGGYGGVGDFPLSGTSIAPFSPLLALGADQGPPLFHFLAQD